MRILSIIRTHDMQMAVVKERFSPSDVTITGTALSLLGMRRRSDGTWMFEFKVDIEALLPDGRRVPLDRYVVLPGNGQFGRRAPVVA